LEIAMSELPMPSMNALSTLFNSVELVKKAWPSFNLPSQFAPTMDVNELDKRLNDLRAVEQWLSLNLKMLHGTIEGLELQRNAIAALNEFGKSTTSPLQAQSQPQPKTEPPVAAAPVDEPSRIADIASQVNPAAWWSLLQSQFSQIAEAALRPQETTTTRKSAAASKPTRKTTTAKTRAKSAKALGK
jgi:hypothetical protein